MTTKEEQYLKAFGKNMKKLRESKGFSIRNFAHEIDASHATIFRLETGKTNPSILIVLKIAEALETDVATLLLAKGNK